MREICPIIQSSPMSTLKLYVIDISIIIFYSATFVYLCSFFLPTTEQEPSMADSDSDPEEDLVLSLETETGLLTNQHTKGKREIELGNGK
jgi:hypothetical protein